MAEDETGALLALVPEPQLTLFVRVEGRVEIDDAYLGGERTGGKRGRGSNASR